MEIKTRPFSSNESPLSSAFSLQKFWWFDSEWWILLASSLSSQTTIIITDPADFRAHLDKWRGLLKFEGSRVGEWLMGKTQLPLFLTHARLYSSFIQLPFPHFPLAILLPPGSLLLMSLSPILPLHASLYLLREPLPQPQYLCCHAINVEILTSDGPGRHRSSWRRRGGLGSCQAKRTEGFPSTSTVLLRSSVQLLCPKYLEPRNLQVCCNSNDCF